MSFINGRKSLHQIHEWACIYIKVLFFNDIHKYIINVGISFVYKKEENEQKRIEDFFLFWMRGSHGCIGNMLVWAPFSPLIPFHLPLAMSDNILIV